MKKRMSIKKFKKQISDRQKVYKIISRIYKELRNNQDIIFKKLRGCQGEYDLCEDSISIDYRKELLPTLVHEFIHKFHPEKCEQWVLKQERFVMKRISSSQAKRLLMFLSYRI